METGKSTHSETLKSHIAELRWYIAAIAMVDVLAIMQGLSLARGVGSAFGGYSGGMLLALVPIVGTLVLMGAAAVMLTTQRAAQVVDLARVIFRWLARIRKLLIPIFILISLGLAAAFLLDIRVPVLWYFPPIWQFGHLVIIGAVLWCTTRRLRPQLALLASATVFGFGLVVMRFLPQLSTYPLTMDWSEATRFFDASLFFSQRIYGVRFPLPVLDPTRALMQSPPFLIPELPIWAHRFWRILLWLGTTSLAGHALARRVQFKNRWLHWGLVAWFMLFTFQGPVYFHLMVMVILVLLGFDRKRPWRSLLFVGLASVWAGLSRVNWFPVPGLLAAVLYILETPQDGKGFWAYWRWPVLAVLVGLAVAFAAQAGYAILSGNPQEAFATSFDSPLFAYRLFPNAAYGPGVIHLMLAASIPLWSILGWSLARRLRQWRALRLLALLVILLGLMGAGLIVSTKIGGGNNLHNLDSYLVVLAVICIYAVSGRFMPDRAPKGKTQAVPPILILLAFLVPMVTQLDALTPLPNLKNQQASADLDKIQALIDDLDPGKDEVLFIQDRHLLPMGLVQDVDLVPEYEKVILMEMAMSNNEAYLAQFHSDLQNQRFDLIVMEEIQIYILSPDHYFGEENNVWINQVVYPMLAHYQVVLDLPKSDLTLLIPKGE
ncbi:hypothetical protein KQH50_00330 [bacterium]|nr:hypothetical protein [bacterium]